MNQKLNVGLLVAAVIIIIILSGTLLYFVALNRPDPISNNFTTEKPSADSESKNDEPNQISVQDDIADWQTQENLEFEIKYPQNEQFKEDFSTSTTSGFFKIIDPEKSDDYDININIEQEKNYNNLEDIQNNPNDLRFVGDITFIGKTKIADEDALEYRTLFGGDNGDNWREEFILYRNNKVYNIGYNIDAKTKKAINPFTAKILSTFKFIEKAAVSGDLQSAKLFCQNLASPGYEALFFGYFSNNKGEKFVDCGISSADPANPGGAHIIAKYISGSWKKIWTGNGDILQDDIDKYNIPNEIYDPIR